MAGISQISHDDIGNVFWAGNDLYISASASQAAGVAPVTIADLLAGANADDTPALVGAKLLTIGVFNNATGQTITGLSLQAQGTTPNGGTFAIPYPITADVNGNAVSIASGASQTFLVPLGNGVLRTWVLTPTFGTAPAAGTIDTVTTVQGAAGNGSVQKGSLALQNGTITVTTTAQQLPTQGGSSVLLQSALANTDNILFGNSTTQSMELAPGASTTITVNNLNLLYVVAASGTPILNWMVLS